MELGGKPKVGESLMHVIAISAKEDSEMHVIAISAAATAAAQCVACSAVPPGDQFSTFVQI